MSDVGALSRNPFGLIKSAPLPRSASTARHLYLEDLRAVVNYVNNLEGHVTGTLERKRARQRWLWFAYLLSGLRISELLNHTTHHIYSEMSGGEKVWMMAVAGKGRAHAEPHPLPDQFLEELWRYRASLDLEPWPQTPAPLVVSLSGTKAMTNRSTAHKTLKDFIDQVAQSQETQGNFDSAARLRTASTHWLRHSFVTCLLDTTTDIPAVSSLARHRDLKTTMRYDHSELGALKSVLNEFANAVS